MGGRGTFAIGNMVAYTYETIGFIEGIKILSGLNGKHGLPEEAHSSHAYIKLKKDGTFHEMRVYDKDHYLKFEIAYHPEPSLDKSRKPVLHYHVYDRSFHRSSAMKMSKPMKKHFKKYLKGVTV
jgi:hypothetical protein